jgi:SAM-dependent methyltransferase
MKMFKNIFLLAVSFFALNVVAKDDHLQKVLYTPRLRIECAKFFNNVLRQIPAQDVFAAADKNKKSIVSDDALYAELLTQLAKYKNSRYIVNKIKALNRQKIILSTQAKELLGRKVNINGYVEIGTPATYLDSMSSFLNVGGTRYVLSFSEQWSDYIQAHSLNPLNGFKAYDTFIDINNYDPILYNDIPSSSTDLVVCFIGLHHVPTEKLDAFVKSIKRILRPGGILLLRDHDSHSHDMNSIVHAAHTTFNIISTGETLAGENAEYRNFQPLGYWIDLLDRYDFDVSHKKLLQDGDPTLNTMMKFTKRATNKFEEIELFSLLTLENDVGYKKDITNTFLTSPEWVNVDIAQEYSEFINHTPFYEFPYWKSIASYWAVFKGSFDAASRRKGFANTALSMDTAMNVFIGSTMTVEFAIKSLISLPIRLIFAGSEDEYISVIVSDPKNEIQLLDKRIKVVNTKPHHLKLVKIPRYKEFLKIIKKLNKTAITIHEIAGQKEIQFKVRCHKNQQCLLTKLRKEYEWQLPTKPDYIYTGLSVEVGSIRNVLSYLSENNIELLYVHDF